ncbi:MAG: hypothetical protein ACK4XJ_03220 [Fimbriimonadaceae bacterium]
MARVTTLTVMGVLALASIGIVSAAFAMRRRGPLEKLAADLDSNLRELDARLNDLVDEIAEPD